MKTKSPVKKKKKDSREKIRDKIRSLAPDFLLHEGPFSRMDYITEFDRYKQYIRREPKEKQERILEFMKEQQTLLFFGGELHDDAISAILENYEKKYQQENKMEEEDLPEALYRVKRKHLKHLLGEMLPSVFRGFAYDHDFEPEGSSRPIVFSKTERKNKWVIGFDMGPYGAGVWTSIFIGLADPEVILEVDRYMDYSIISYEDLEDCQKKLVRVLDILSKITPVFFEAIRAGNRKSG